MAEYVVSEQTVIDNITNSLLEAIGLTVDAGVPAAHARRVVDAAVADLPTVQVEDRAEFVAAQTSQVDQLLNAITVLLVLSVVIAVLGIVNTLALSVVERTRELGVLRAVGLQRPPAPAHDPGGERRQRALGLLVGSAFGWALVRELREQGVTQFALPVGRLTFVVVVACLAGVLAAALPARRAARLDVLAAMASS